MAAIESKTIMRLNGISKTYKASTGLFGDSGQRVIALNDVSLEIGRGEIFGLVGQSGSGKTTMGRLVVKLENPDKGSIRLGDDEVGHLKGAGLKAFRMKVQMIFQDPYQSLNPHLSILDTIAEPLAIHGKGSRRDRRDKVMKSLEVVGMSPGTDYLYRYPHQLSGGQRQRVAIARAMVLKPEFVVADEPASMLDATIAIQLFRLLLDIRERHGVTFLFITHNLAAARYLCDRIAVIHQGEIVETGKTEEIIRAPQHAYTRRLIAAQPKFAYGGAEGKAR
ncbi:MAG: ATP-binding cassette domain-containing protein [Deltaproteobacteria bacterium]|nr:ATP-binding cassette domain-containing protein [Deltaproteobacteria bacterium]